MRLIDADKLLIRIGLNYSNHQKVSASDIKDIIDTTKTAYDVDKVVAELDEQWNNVNCIDDDMYCIGVANGLADAIDIVKRGEYGI